MLRIIRRSKSLAFNNKVALVTGAGNGLGREYALELGRRGAVVLVNDIGGDVSGSGSNSNAVDVVCNEIQEAGGKAVPVAASVMDTEAVMKPIIDQFGRLDILINNAGILRDKTMLRISADDWNSIIAVHLTAAFNLTQAAFSLMKENKYGKIINTSSASGIYGNFGQTNYAAAKMGLVGLTKSVALEGKKFNVTCNAIAPIAASRMTKDIFPEYLLEKLDPKYVVPVTLYLAHENCTESGSVFEVGGGWAAKIRIQSAKGCMLSPGKTPTMEDVESNFNELCDFGESMAVNSLQEATMRIISAVNQHEST